MMERQGPDASNAILDSHDEANCFNPAHHILHRASKNGSSPAVLTDTHTDSFADLAGLVQSWRQVLADLGLEPGDLVAVDLERSNMWVALTLALLTDGMVHVAVDQTLSESQKTRLKSAVGCVAWIDDDSRRILGSRVPKPRHSYLGSCSPEAPAFMISTSGSTGVPKRVLLPQGGLCTLGLHASEAYGLLEVDRVAQLAPIGFDVSLWEMLVPLLVGACVCIPPLNARLPGLSLTDWLIASSVTVISTTPTNLAQFPSRNIPLLRLVIAGGEAVDFERLQRWARGSELQNVYGPTEASVDCLLKRNIRSARDVSLGTALPGVTWLVLDGSGKECPAGIPGELLLAGSGLAIGYHDDAALTNEKFVFLEGTRYYRTGDLVKVGDFGELHFIGRQDRQIKYRGVRLELESLERATIEIDGVSSAVAIVHGVGAGARLIVHYEGVKPIESSSARQHLQTRLPRYMLPSEFRFHKRLPVTVRGKVDTMALESEDDALASDRRNIERRVLRTWQAVLDEDGIQLSDNFFDLGGHSLQATRLVGALNDVFELELDLGAFMADPTPAGCVRAVTSSRED